jgi:hypothetical protein
MADHLSGFTKVKILDGKRTKIGIVFQVNMIAEQSYISIINDRIYATTS